MNQKTADTHSNSIKLKVIVATIIFLLIICISVYAAYRLLPSVVLSSFGGGPAVQGMPHPPDSPADATYDMHLHILPFVCIIAAATIAYIFFCFTLFINKLKQADKNLAILDFMYKVGSSLSNAAVDPDCVKRSLSMIAERYSASRAAFFVIKSGKFYDTFSTSDEFSRNTNRLITGIPVKAVLPVLFNSMLSGDCVCIHLRSPSSGSADPVDDLTRQIKAGQGTAAPETSDSFAVGVISPLPDRGTHESDEPQVFLSQNVVRLDIQKLSFLKYADIRIAMAVPVITAENKLKGMLCICDPGIPAGDMMKFEKYRCLNSVSGDFSTGADNIEALALVRNMGTVDLTTGLLNRNSYKKALAELELHDGRPFACIFIDVNGLHAMNNTYGHDKGDKMLRFVADTLKNFFPDDEVFRIGGDEFIIFARDHSLSVIDLRVAQINARITDADYSVSIGVEWRDHDFDLAEMVRSADLKMFTAKKRYYSTVGDRRGS